MPIITLPGGELRDEIRNSLYDTVVLAAGAGLAGVQRFFSTVTTIANVPKSLMATNMKQSGQLETAVSFRVQGLAFDSQNSAASNQKLLPVILQKSSLSLNVGVKNYWQGPGRFIGGRMLESGIAGTDLPLGRIFQQFGWPAVQPVIFQGKHVIDINPLQNFNMVMEISSQDLTAAEAALTVAVGTDQLIVCSLKGLLRRPVQ